MRFDSFVDDTAFMRDQAAANQLICRIDRDTLTFFVPEMFHQSADVVRIHLAGPSRPNRFSPIARQVNALVLPRPGGYRTLLRARRAVSQSRLPADPPRPR